MTIDVSEIVCASLAQVCREQGLYKEAIRPELSIIDDLGFDSLVFVDLIVLLEERTALSNLPLLDWVDREARRRTDRYTVQSLIEEVRVCVAKAK